MGILYRRLSHTHIIHTSPPHNHKRSQSQPLEISQKPSSLQILPNELYVQIATYLDPISAAGFSLTSRSALYALGTQHLRNALTSATSKEEVRFIFSQTLERAFPSSWFCAWCDRFHAWTSTDGPTATAEGREIASGQKCKSHNGALSFSNYTLRYHHMRLALAHARLGHPHGLPLPSFDHTTTTTTALFRTPVRTKTTHSARIFAGQFLLYTAHTLLLPSFAAHHRNILDALVPTLPPGLLSHAPTGTTTTAAHDGALAALDNVLRRGWRYPAAMPCSRCNTEYAISAYGFAGGYVQLRIRVWRDLGSGESPFEEGWRAHVGLRGYGGRGCGGEAEGEGVRRRYELGGGGGGVGGDEKEWSEEIGVYTALKRRRLLGSAVREEIRRSRVVSWRTAAENEAACMLEEERRWEARRAAVERAVRIEEG